MHHEIWYIQKFEKTQVRSTCLLSQNDIHFGTITIFVILELFYVQVPISCEKGLEN